MRPLIAADPMLRAPNPEIVSESTSTGAGCCADSMRATPATSNASARAEQRPILIGRSSLVRRRLHEPPVVDGDVGLDLLVRDLRLVLTASLARLERVGQVHAGDLLVVAEGGLGLLFRPAD